MQSERVRPARPHISMSALITPCPEVDGRAIGILAVKEGPAHFEPLAALCMSGDVRIHIYRTFALDEVPAALAQVGEGRASGKLVVVLS